MLIDANSHVPIYQQIVDQLRSAIAGGAYRPGELLPSQRDVALRMRVNPNTVQRAFEVLERDGLVEARRGTGMVVTSGAVTAARRQAADVLSARLAAAINEALASGLTQREVRSAFRAALPGRSGVGRWAG